jgi:hypothetical protein
LLQVKLLDKMMHAQAEVAEQQVVVLSQVLANEVNIGYEDILNTQVLQLNGKRIVNMRDLVAAVDSCREEYLHFDLDYNQKVAEAGGWSLLCFCCALEGVHALA